MEHTKLPWRTGLNFPQTPNYIYQMNDTKQAYPIAVTRLQMGSEDMAQAQANAEFIVKACNSHYELLEACKFLKDQIENQAANRVYKAELGAGEWEALLTSKEEEILGKINAAIAKAEGKS